MKKGDRLDNGIVDPSVHLQYQNKKSTAAIIQASGSKKKTKKRR